MTHRIHLHRGENTVFILRTTTYVNHTKLSYNHFLQIGTKTPGIPRLEDAKMDGAENAQALWLASLRNPQRRCQYS